MPSGRVSSKRYSTLSVDRAITTSATFPVRRARAAAESSIRAGSSSGLPVSRAIASDAAGASAWIATLDGASGRLRKAMPSPAVIRTGKRKVQKIASGSRTNSRIRTRTNRTSGRSVNRRGASAIAQGPTGQVDEHILECGRVGSELGQGKTAGSQQRQQRRNGAMGLGRLEEIAVFPAADAERARQLEQLGIGEGRLVGWTAGRLVVADAELEDVLSPQRSDQIAGPALRNHFAVIHDRHPVAEPLGLFHVMSGDHDGAPGPLDLFDRLPELPAGLGIETGGRLIEKEQLRIGHQGAGQGEPLLLAARELAHPAVALFTQLHRGQHLLERAGPLVEAPKELQGLGDGELLAELGFLERNAQPLPERRAALAPLLAQHQHLPRIGDGEPFADLDGGGLSGAIGPEEAETLPREHFEVESVDGDDLAECLAETAERDGRGGHGRES